MRALVVFESMYGNTQRIAEAVAAGLRTEVETDLFEVSSAPRSTDGYEVVVVGGPTHAFTMSTRQSREDSAKKVDTPIISTGTGIRDWIDSVAPHRDELPCATFDTRFDRPTWLTGSAARRASGRMHKRGFGRLSPATSFFVEHGQGPLVEGETDRAFEWGERMAVRLVMSG